MVDQSRAHPELVNTLKSSKCLNCGHINVDGLYHKIDEVRLLLDEAKIHILAVSETHLNKEVSDNEIEIENYSFIRKDRDQKTGKKWGGVLIYFESRINIHKINYDFELGTTEAILIEADLRSQKLLLACIYRPPNDKLFFGETYFY